MLHLNLLSFPPSTHQNHFQKKTTNNQNLQEIEDEHHQRLIKERTLKIQASNAKKSFFPLVPLERPIVLPGGRKWRNEKDAFNDEFIAEVLSSQAELIVGSTLG